MTIVLGILLILASVFLIVAVLLQGGKSNNRLSGAIAGGAETFFGKSKADTMEKKLSKITAIVAVVFAVLVLVVYLMQDTTNFKDYAAPADTAAAADTAETEPTEIGLTDVNESGADTTAAAEN